MRLETIPIILGVLFALAGAVLIADAFVPDGTFAPAERRARPRPPRNHWGEAALGLAAVVVGAALLAGDRWRYTTLAMLLALILGVTGVALNWQYVKGMLFPGTASAGGEEE